MKFLENWKTLCPWRMVPNPWLFLKQALAVPFPTLAGYGLRAPDGPASLSHGACGCVLIYTWVKGGSVGIFQVAVVRTQEECVCNVYVV